MNLSQLNRILLQTLLLPVVALLLVSGALIWQIGNAQKTVSDLQDADHNIATATYILALTGDEESGVRGFQNTSNEAFLQPFQNARGPLAASVSMLRRDLAARGEEPSLLDQFLVSHQRWIDTVAVSMIALVRSGGDTRDVALNLRGKDEMDRIRDILNELISEQKLQRQNGGALADSGPPHVGSYRWLRRADRPSDWAIRTQPTPHGHTRIPGRDHRAAKERADPTYDSEQRLRTTLTSIGDGVVVCDQHGRVELLNTVARAINRLDAGGGSAKADQRGLSHCRRGLTPISWRTPSTPSFARGMPSLSPTMLFCFGEVVEKFRSTTAVRPS